MRKIQGNNSNCTPLCGIGGIARVELLVFLLVNDDNIGHHITSNEVGHLPYLSHSFAQINGQVDISKLDGVV